MIKEKNDLRITEEKSIGRTVRKMFFPEDSVEHRGFEFLVIF